jgi:hypothetical protein
MAHALILENIITHDVKYIVPEHVWLIVGLKFYVEFRNSLKAVNFHGIMMVYSTRCTAILLWSWIHMQISEINILIFLVGFTLIGIFT